MHELPFPQLKFTQQKCFHCGHLNSSCRFPQSSACQLRSDLFNVPVFAKFLSLCDASGGRAGGGGYGCYLSGSCSWTVYIWRIHLQMSRLNLISLSAPYVSPSVLGVFFYVSSLVTLSAFHRNVSASTPAFSRECRMENVQLSFFFFFHISVLPSVPPPGTRSLLKRISFDRLS